MEVMQDLTGTISENPRQNFATVVQVGGHKRRNVTGDGFGDGFWADVLTS